MKANNKKELKAVRANLLKVLEEMQKELADKLQPIYEDLQSIHEAIKEQYDNLSERAQEGRSGEICEDDMADIENILDDIEEYAFTDDNSQLKADDPDRYESLPILNDTLQDITNLIDKQSSDY